MIVVIPNLFPEAKGAELSKSLNASDENCWNTNRTAFLVYVNLGYYGSPTYIRRESRRFLMSPRD